MLPAYPSADDIFVSRMFEEPLVPIGAEPRQAETTALAAALRAYAARSGPDDFSALVGYVERSPSSPWVAAVLTTLGLEYYNTGHYSKALRAWADSWQLCAVATDPRGRALADRTVGELAALHARLGQMAELQTVLDGIEGRVLSGPATERIVGAREALATMRLRPEIAFRCGPLALHRMLLALDPPGQGGQETIIGTRSPPEGFSMAELGDLARELGLEVRLAYRQPGAAIVVPSVVHFQLGHFAAVVRQDGDRYLLQDATFGNDVWVSGAALEDEASGHFLVAAQSLPPGWREMDLSMAKSIRGKGYTTGNDPDPHGDCDPHTPGGGPCGDSNTCDCKGMAVAQVHLMLVSLNLNDTPVGYAPPVGPHVAFTVRYHQRDARQPANFSYSNLGPKWTFDWLAYLTDNPGSPSGDVGYYRRGGGSRTFTGFDGETRTFAVEQYDQARLTRTSATAYEMRSPDGSRRIFDRPDGSGGTSRKVFLGSVVDPAGNAVSLDYDTDLRLVRITDTIGQATTIAYQLPDDRFKITKVTDPFGRSATFDYDAARRLVRITDVAGLISEFGYDAGDFVTSLTTPYGVTRFSKTENGTTRALETVFPDGNRDRVEFNQSTNLGIPGSDPRASVPAEVNTRNEFLAFRNTYYWDKLACAYAYGDHTKARLYHWLHTPNIAVTAGILESTKEPLEGRVWYDYAGQSIGPIVVGNTNKPTHIGRVLDDGSTQLYRFGYTDMGKITTMVDPVGRTLSYSYAPNGIDLVEIRQTRAGQSQLLSRRTYNGRHAMLTSTDAAGQTTRYAYNARGQLTSVIDPLGATTTYTYDSDGYLVSTTRPLAEGGVSFAYSYDAVGRLQTLTDPDGYRATLEYDPLDRLTSIGYPDGTTERFGYDRLDRVSRTDRTGRRTTYEYDAVRQLIRTTDPLGRTTAYEWCKCGDKRTVTDALGRSTRWRHDVQGRTVSKHLPDGTEISYRYEDRTSRLRQRVDASMQATNYTYNRDNTASTVSYANASVPTATVTFGYDPDFSRLTAMTDGAGTTRYSYYPVRPKPAVGAGRLASIEGPLPAMRIDYRYDQLGRVVIREIDGFADGAEFDPRGRLREATTALGRFSYHYDGQTPRPLTVTHPNGIATQYTYLDNLGDRELAQIDNMHGATPVSQLSYRRDTRADRITSLAERWANEPPATSTFAYDAADQLVGATVVSAGGTNRTFAYAYDPAGNRLSETIDQVADVASYNALNQLTTSDAAGSGATYEWDVEQRLVAVNSADRRTEYGYDGKSRLVRLRVVEAEAETADRRFLWDNDQICQERDSGGALVKRFYPNGVRVERGPHAGSYFYTRDHLGSIRSLLDADGAVVARFGYDPYGRRSRIAGTVPADFGFAAQFFDESTGLSLAPLRAYDPNLGRWLSREPMPRAELRGGTNAYAYVLNNPVNLVDPYGAQHVQPKVSTPPAERPPQPCNINVLEFARTTVACAACVVEGVAAARSGQPGGTFGAFAGGGGGNFCGICVSGDLGVSGCTPSLPTQECLLWRVEGEPFVSWESVCYDAVDPAGPQMSVDPSPPGGPNMCIAPSKPKPPKLTCGG